MTMGLLRRVPLGLRCEEMQVLSIYLLLCLWLFWFFQLLLNVTLEESVMVFQKVTASLQLPPSLYGASYFIIALTMLTCPCSVKAGIAFLRFSFGC